jgi:alpha-galactosidase
LTPLEGLEIGRVKSSSSEEEEKERLMFFLRKYRLKVKVTRETLFDLINSMAKSNQIAILTVFSVFFFAQGQGSGLEPRRHLDPGLEPRRHGNRGSNTWDSYCGPLNQSTALARAQWQAANLLSSGYDVFTLDEGWSSSTSIDSYGRQIAQTSYYPDFEGLIAQVHALGLRFGVWTIRGIPLAAVSQNLPIANSSYTATTAGRAVNDPTDKCSWSNDNVAVLDNAAGAAYYASVAQHYKGMGIDFVKVDCMITSNGTGLYTTEFTLFAREMRAVGIELSVSPGVSMNAANFSYMAQNSLATEVRITNDLWDFWSNPDCDSNPQTCYPTDVRSKLDLIPQYFPYTGLNGLYPDPDMLPLGHILHDGCKGPASYTRLSENEQITLLSIEYMARSPLIFGGLMPLDDTDTFTLPTLTNPEALAVHSFSEGPRVVNTSVGDGRVYAFVADAIDVTGDIFVALFQANDVVGPVGVKTADVGVFPGVNVCARSLWERANVPGTFNDKTDFVVTLQPHQAGLYRLTSCST